MIEKQHRRQRFELKLTPQERSEWEALAEAAGCGNNLSKFVRHCVSGRPLPPPVPTLNEDTYWQLGKIGTNLNQIAKGINEAIKSGQKIDAEIHTELTELRELLIDIRLRLIGVRK